MSPHRESQEGLLELEERLHPSIPPTYDENEPMILLDVCFRFWAGDECHEKKARYVFNAKMTLQEAMDLAVYKNEDSHCWTEKYAFYMPPNDQPGLIAELVALPDTQSLLKHIVQDKDTIVICNLADPKAKKMKVDGKTLKKVLWILAFVLVSFFIFIVIMDNMS